ncbi:MAG: hypothetical protein ACJA2S_001083 [Cyclobacteriaceae bacterium]|jgi:hypothetical protein|tara:strand:+ start:1549 stop:2133 length:585 start_codon:yes stop_codon:yes gene_type:complete
MKKFIIMASFGILFSSCINKQQAESRDLDKFDKVNIEGRIEVHLERNSYNSIRIETKSDSEITDLVAEVRNGELFIYHEKECDSCEEPKYIIHLNHSGISDLSLKGIITLRSDDSISQKSLSITGDGILNGNLEVSLETLKVDLKGISNMYISGYAETSTIKLAGIGLVNARSLKTKSAKKSTDGLAIVRLSAK